MRFIGWLVFGCENICADKMTGILSAKRVALSAAVVVVLLLAARSPAQTVVPACAVGYGNSYQPALVLSDLPRKVAYGRKVFFAVVRANSNTNLVEDESVVLTIQGEREAAPYLDKIEPGEIDTGDSTYFILPERKEGSYNRVALSWVETYTAADLTGQTCRRSVVQDVRSIDGAAPHARIRVGSKSVSVRVESPNKQCAQTRPGKLLLRIRGPDRTSTLVLPDACSSKWGRAATGRGWSLRGDRSKPDGRVQAAVFEGHFETNGTREFAIAALFGGKAIARDAFAFSTRIGHR